MEKGKGKMEKETPPDGELFHFPFSLVHYFPTVTGAFGTDALPSGVRSSLMP